MSELTDETQTDWKKLQKIMDKRNDAARYKVALLKIAEWGEEGAPAGELVEIARDAVGVRE